MARRIKIGWKRRLRHVRVWRRRPRPPQNEDRFGGVPCRSG
jgi:hypothetical protein